VRNTDEAATAKPYEGDRTGRHHAQAACPGSERGRCLKLLAGDLQLLLGVPEVGSLALKVVEPESVLRGHRVQQQQRDEARAEDAADKDGEGQPTRDGDPARHHP
jgi:hypothetical protein